MFQIDKFQILKNAEGNQTGISIKFFSGEDITVNFDDIPSGLSATQKAEWLKSKLNELLGQHYKANVVLVNESPFTVGVSVEAL
jgi:hypothetical protein